MTDIDLTRLSMNLNRRGQAAIMTIRAIEDVNVTDAVHRAVLLYARLLQEQEDGNEVLLRDKKTRDITKITWS